jgi:fermentation-respiration switch protein FrsA (DUF1100 family)
MLRWFEYRQVYHPTREWVVPGAPLSAAREEVQLTTTDGVRLDAWFFPAKADSPRARLVVLVCHGNGGNMSHRFTLFGMLLRLGVNVMSFDYRGYGRSEGRPSEEGTYRDAQAAYRHLCQRGFAPGNIIAFGVSLGGAIACELALRETVGGLVLQSTFTSIPAMGVERFPWLPVRRFSTIHYDTLSKLPRLKVPFLITHSRADSVVPFHHAEENFAAAPEPKILCEPGGDHDESLLPHADEYLEAWERFLALLGQKEQGAMVEPVNV